MPNDDAPLQVQVDDLRRDVAELKSMLSHDNVTRAQLLDSCGKLLPSLASSQQHWETLYATHLENLRKSPEIGRLRGEGLTEHFNNLWINQQELQVQHRELCGVVVTLFTEIRELTAFLRGESR